jgi:hypothetical protein
MKIRYLIAAIGCGLLLSGCTKSNIVHTGETQIENADPDFEMYNDIEIDLDQLTEDVNEVGLDPEIYPMASAIRFSIRLDEEVVDIDVVVKDGTSNEDAAWYAGEAIKVVNDQVASQDFSYAESDEQYFGGLYQDATINLSLYYESDFPDGDSFYETSVEPDSYGVFVID